MEIKNYNYKIAFKENLFEFIWSGGNAFAHFKNKNNCIYQEKEMHLISNDETVKMALGCF